MMAAELEPYGDYRDQYEDFSIDGLFAELRQLRADIEDVTERLQPLEDEKRELSRRRLAVEYFLQKDAIRRERAQGPTSHHDDAGLGESE